MQVVVGTVLGAALLMGNGGAARAVSPEWAATASAFLPGLGQLINGDTGEGVVHLGGSFLASGLFLGLSEQPEYLDFEERVDDANRIIHTNRTTVAADLALAAAFNLTLYSSYDAYRDERLRRRNRGYGTPPPAEGLDELALAPFRWELLSRPTSIAPLVFPLLFALMAPDNTAYLVRPDNSISRDQVGVSFFALHEMVAVGEESFFRGILNNGFSSSLGEGWGLAISSALFGVAHQGEAGQATAAGAGLFGAYLGYLQQRNDYRIDQGVAIHFWWNFITSLAMLRNRADDAPVQIFAFATRF